MQALTRRMRRILGNTKVALCLCMFALIVLSGVVFLSLSLRPAVVHYTPLPEEPLLEVAQKVNEAGETWLRNNITPDGFFYYSFNPYSGEYGTDNNELRQLMAVRAIAVLAANDPADTPLHLQTLNAVMDRWYVEQGDIAYILYEDKSKLGANAMLLRALVASPFYETYTAEAKKTADGILSLQNENGSFRPWLIEPDYDYNADYLLTFYSGEALLALMEYAERSGEEEYIQAAKKSAEFYLVHYVENMEQNYYPAYVPWHTLAYNHLYKATGDRRYANAIFTLNDTLLDMFDREHVPGRFYNEELKHFGRPHTASDSVYTEGLAYAYEIALMVGDETHASAYHEVLDLSVRHLASLQYLAPIPSSPLPVERYYGAIATNHESPWVRVDNTQHTVDALTKLQEVMLKYE